MQHDEKVALIHDWITGMRGGEKVLQSICRLYPRAPLYTLLFIPGSSSPLIENRVIKTSLLQHLPFSFKRYRHYLPLYPLLAEMHKVRGVDLVISTSHAVAKSMVARKGPGKPVHICYIHTPMRYVWDRFDDYFGPERVGWFLSRFFFAPIAWYLRLYDKMTAKRVDRFLANSSFIAQRVKRCYGREADVLFPPVEVERFAQVRREPTESYLVLSALVPYKKVDHAIRACSELGRCLVIVGSGPEERALRDLAQSLGAQVEFKGGVDGTELLGFYGKARALLFPGLEDFGIVPVEAIASGCPVIAYGAGGVLDSMTEKTAVFYTEQTVEGLKNAISEFEKNPNRFQEKDLRERADFFSEENFLKRLRAFIEDTKKKYA